MISAFGVDHSLVAKKEGDSQRTQHYGRMAGITGTIGGIAGGTSLAALGTMKAERKGHDPMGFIEPNSPEKKPLSEIPMGVRARVLRRAADEHKWMAQRGAVAGGAGLALAGGYKLRQRAERHKQAQLTKAAYKPDTRSKKAKAADTGLGAGALGLGGATAWEGQHAARAMGEHVKEAYHNARWGHHIAAGAKMAQSDWPFEPEHVKWAARQRKVHARAAALKAPVVAGAGVMTAAGGLGAYELARNRASRHRND